MVDYSKLFNLLREMDMKKSDLLDVISGQTLAKLSKNENVRVDIIDRICIHLGAQPNDIMEIYEYQEVDGKKLKVKTGNPLDPPMPRYTAGEKSITYGQTLEIIDELLNPDGTLNTEKLYEMQNKINQ